MAGIGANFVQTSFLGGEWSPNAQGRSDLPGYRAAMNTCLNTVLLEEGAATRRPGFLDLGPSAFNQQGIVRRFDWQNNQPIIVEITIGGGHPILRTWYWDGFHYKPSYNDSATVTGFSAVSPTVMTISGATLPTWNTDDVVYIEIDGAIAANKGTQLANRQFKLTRLTNTTYNLTDIVTGVVVDGTALNAAAGMGTTQVRRIQHLAHPWADYNEVQTLDFVPADATAYILSPVRLPQVLILTNPLAVSPSPPSFTLADAGFGALDGPYLDPLPGLSQTNNSTGTLTAPSLHTFNKFPGSAISGAGPGGTATFAITDAAYSFVAGDVGRCIRVWNQPPVWDSTKTYANGDCVTWNGTYWKRNPGAAPGTIQDQPGMGVPYYDSHTTTIVFPWELNPQIANWAYGTITGFTNSSTVTITFAASSGLTNWSATGPITDQGNGPVIDTWELGAYCVGHFPARGTYHEGRLWLAAAYPNRFDASQPLTIQSGGNQRLNFSPTDMFGQVTADKGINYTVSAPGLNQFVWMIPDHQGILAGTQTAEWLIASSNLSNPLTPTDIQAKKVSAYKCADKRPIRVGNAIIFIQQAKRRLMEYIADVFSGKFIGRHLNKYAKHLSSGGFRELAYQEELSPTLWACDIDGGLFGVTYRRESQFGSEQPVFYGCHQHAVADQRGARKIISVCSGAVTTGEGDGLCTLSQDTNSAVWLSLMSPILDATDPLYNSHYLDCYYTGNANSGSGGVTGRDPSLDGGATGIKFNGLYYKAGKTVTVTILGLDCGDYTVAADGSIFVPYLSDPGAQLTAAYIVANASTLIYGDIATIIQVNNGGFVSCVVPVLIGTTYTSTVQLVRPETEAETKGQTGPGHGKTRRVFRWSAKFVNTVGNSNGSSMGLQVGTDINFTRPVVFVQLDNVTPLAQSVLYTGVFRDIMDDDYGFDGMLLWTQSRPYPCTIASVGCFLNVEDL